MDHEDKKGRICFAIWNKFATEHDKHDWTFRTTGDFSSWLGYTNYTRKEVVINKQFIYCGEYEPIKQVILHECAHVLTGSKHVAHGNEWRMNCIKLGIYPHVTGDADIAYKYLISCRCGASRGLYGKNGKRRCLSCGKYGRLKRLGESSRARRTRMVRRRALKSWADVRVEEVPRAEVKPQSAQDPAQCSLL
mgnify:CR=1 FL=1